MGEVIIKDNTAQAIAAMQRAKARALEIVGGVAETNVKGLTPVDTGALRNSFTHKVDGDRVTIGSNMEYAPFVELGTGKHYSPPTKWMEAQVNTAGKGRGLDHWVYMGRDGKFHMGFPREGVHMLEYGIVRHLEQYKSIIRNELSKG